MLLPYKNKLFMYIFALPYATVCTVLLFTLVVISNFDYESITQFKSIYF